MSAAGRRPLTLLLDDVIVVLIRLHVTGATTHWPPHMRHHHHLARYTFAHRVEFLNSATTMKKKTGTQIAESIAQLYFYDTRSEHSGHPLNHTRALTRSIICNCSSWISHNRIHSINALEDDCTHFSASMRYTNISYTARLDEKQQHTILAMRATWFAISDCVTIARLTNHTDGWENARTPVYGFFATSRRRRRQNTHTQQQKNTTATVEYARRAHECWSEDVQELNRIEIQAIRTRIPKKEEDRLRIKNHTCAHTTLTLAQTLVCARERFDIARMQRLTSAAFVWKNANREMCVLVSKGVGCFRYRKSEFGWNNISAENTEAERKRVSMMKREQWYTLYFDWKQ